MREREAARNQGIEASKFLKPVAPQQEIPEPLAPTPEPPAPVQPAARPPIDLTIYAPKEPQPDQGWTERLLTEEFKGLQPPPPPEPEQPKREWEPDELYRLRQEIWRRQVFEMQQHAEANSAEYKHADAAGKNANAWKLEDFDLRQQEALQAAQERQQPEPKTGWRAALDRILKPDDEGKKLAEQQEQLDIIRARQEQERRDYIKKLEQDRARELEALRARHLREQAEREKKYDAELERHIREKKRALELQRELDAEEREKQLGKEEDDELGRGKG